MSAWKLIEMFAHWRSTPKHLASLPDSDAHIEQCAYDYCDWCAKHRDDGWWQAEDEYLQKFVLADVARTWLRLSDMAYQAQYDQQLQDEIAKAKRTVRDQIASMDIPELNSITEPVSPSEEEAR